MGRPPKNYKPNRDSRLPNPSPLAWPEDWNETDNAKRLNSRYRVPFGETRRQLVINMNLMVGKNHNQDKFVISSDVPVQYNGLPYATFNEPNNPAVAVWWISKDTNELMVLACDKWRTVSENLRAILTAVKAFRAIEHSGADQVLAKAMGSFERPALPSSENGAFNQSTTRPQWFYTLQLEAWPTTAEAIRYKFRLLAKKYHPDTGGNADDFNMINTAKDAALEFLNG